MSIRNRDVGLGDEVRGVRGVDESLVQFFQNLLLLLSLFLLVMHCVVKFLCDL